MAIDNVTIQKVRDWFASKWGMEFTPNEVRTSLDRNSYLQRVTPEVAEAVRCDPHQPPIIKEFTSFLLAIKEGRA